MKSAAALNAQVAREIEFADNRVAQQLFGDLNRNLQTVEQATGVAINARGNSLQISGRAHAVELAVATLEQMYGLLQKGYPVFSQDIAFGVKILESSPKARLEEIFLDKVCITARKRVISPKSINQKLYIEAIRENDIVFGIGPAGTGKTYLAVACAVDALERSQVQRIVLTRPAVEAGERLGFLPGDLTQKVDPYLRPLYDALYELMGFDRVQKAFERNALEIAPLAFMRGRTLNNAFVILDEAQNTTPEQMKMFLTRIGFGARAVVTGDVSQIDLPKGQPSGLIDAERVLKRVQGIAVTRFTSADVVRHPLVARIVDAYDAQGSRRRGAGE